MSMGNVILKREIKDNINGITLVALVVTIIILLILAGVSISLLWNEQGLLNNAKTSSEEYNEKSAREKLELALSELKTKKYTDKTYDEQEYIDKELAKQGITKISENIFLVDKYQFEISRSVPSIINELGAGTFNKNIEIKTAKEITEGPFVVGKIQLEIGYDNELSEVTINGEKVAKLEKAEDGKTYTIEQEVTKNGTYHILAKDTEGNYNITSVNVDKITEDMEIWNKADLETFRRKVNEEGRTFENRTVKVMDDIILSESEATRESWKPIGSWDKNFKGTFDGDNHKIKRLYINSTELGQGLFGVNHGTIQNLEMEEGYIKTTERASGLVVGYNKGTIRNIITRGELNGYTQIGGICGANYANIENCTNYANITYNKEGTSKDGNYYIYGWCMGGITGTNWNDYGGNSKVERCTNYGNITGTHGVGGITGDLWRNKFVKETEQKINLCINYGTITGENTEEWPSVGGITGTGGSQSNVIVSNSINVGKVKTATNAGTKGSIGGIEGYCVYSNDGIIMIKNCYNLGTITATSNIKGAIIGDKGSGTMTLNKNYWLSGCGVTIGNKPGNTNTNAEPKTMEELKKMAQDLIASKNQEEAELGNLLKKAIEAKEKETN